MKWFRANVPIIAGPLGARESKSMRTLNEEAPSQGAEAGPALMISIKELAKLLKLSTRHLERMDCVGRIPEPIRFGRTKRWLLSEINAWMAAGCPDRDSWQAMKEVSSDN